MKCRHCAAPLEVTFLDLGFAPPSNAYLSSSDLSKPEKYYPLRIKVCDRCWLAQTEDYADAGDLFSPSYAYFSSTSTEWLEHAARYAEEIADKLALNDQSMVVEIAANDGYLLKNFVRMRIPCLGIEPTESTAAAARKLGIPIVQEFFGEDLAAKLGNDGRMADLIVGNNVYAHVPDINDFTRGLKKLLKQDGTITLEFPHLMRMIEFAQFDTAYHEHFSYLSLFSVYRIFNRFGLRVWDVQELKTHGGSLRVFGCHDDDPRLTTPAVGSLLAQEASRGMQIARPYEEFQDRANDIKNNLLSFLIENKRAGKKIVAYGAAAKGNTLLNYAGIKSDLLSVVYDAAVAKQGKYMPGSHIPILPANLLSASAPDYVLVLPWNIVTEVKQQNARVAESGARFVVAVPRLEIL